MLIKLKTITYTYGLEFYLDWYISKVDLAITFNKILLN